MMVSGKLISITVLVIGLICACSIDTGPSAAAGAVGEPLEVVAIKALDPSDPAQAVIMQWHQALVANDFDEYSRVAVRSVDEGDELRVAAFDRMRRGVPPAIFAYDGTRDFDKLVSEADRDNLKGMRTFSLIGCLQLPGKGRSARVMSVVSAREIEGQWKIYGESFGAPSTPFAGGCPINNQS